MALNAAEITVHVKMKKVMLYRYAPSFRYIGAHNNVFTITWLVYMIFTVTIYNY